MTESQSVSLIVGQLGLDYSGLLDWSDTNLSYDAFDIGMDVTMNNNEIILFPELNNLSNVSDIDISNYINESIADSDSYSTDGNMLNQGFLSQSASEDELDSSYDFDNNDSRDINELSIMSGIVDADITDLNITEVNRSLGVEEGYIDHNNETNLDIYQENHKDAKGRVILASVLRRL